MLRCIIEREKITKPAQTVKLLSERAKSLEGNLNFMFQLLKHFNNITSTLYKYSQTNV